MGERFPIFAVVLLGISAVVPSSAQTDRPGVFVRKQMYERSSAKGDSALPSYDIELVERALNESHALGGELPVEVRIQHLMSLCSSASEVTSRNAKQREWVEELFRAAGEMASSDHLRLNAQATAVRLMASLDVNRAMQLFDGLEPPLSSEFDPRQWVAPELFEKMLAKQGVKAIPRLSVRARKLGGDGAYPYTAMIPVMLKLKDQPEKVSQVFAEALTYYRQGKSQPPGSGDINFISFLRGAHSLRIIPEWLMHEATKEVATEIVRGSANSSGSDTDNFGRSYSYFHVAYSMLQDVDPELAKTVNAQASSAMRSLMSGDSEAMQAEDQWNRTHNAAKYNSDEEYQQLRAKTDDLTRKIMEMSEDGKQHSPEMQTAISEAIASGVNATQRAVDVDPSNAHALRRSAEALQGVVDAASKITPDMTLNEIESIQDSELRAYLLIQFASGIRELQFMREMEKKDAARPVVKTK